MREARPAESGINPSASRWLLAGLAVMVIAATVVFAAMRRTVLPPPPDVARDPLLRSGREIYLSRCVSCHGEKGRGDGPIARSLTGPKPRDFAGEEWKHGDRPEQALSVVSKGVPGTTMSGWASSYSKEEIRAVTAYVFYLAGKPIADAFRAAP